MPTRTKKVTGVILLMVTSLVLESKIRGSLPTCDSGNLHAGLFPLLEVPPLLKRLQGRYVVCLVSRFTSSFGMLYLVRIRLACRVHVL